MVYSLLSMLGTHDKDDMSRTLLAMSSSQDSCIAMRQSGRHSVPFICFTVCLFNGNIGYMYVEPENEFQLNASVRRNV